jgi:hypothetical protein
MMTAGATGSSTGTGAATSASSGRSSGAGQSSGTGSGQDPDGVPGSSSPPAMKSANDPVLYSMVSGAAGAIAGWLADSGSSSPQVSQKSRPAPLT